MSEILLKQISTRGVFGSKTDIQKLVLGDQEGSHLLYRIMGQMDGYVRGNSRFQRKDTETGAELDSSWTKFAGEFVAVNAAGDTFVSGLCFLPDYISGPFRNRLDQGEEIQFAFDIYAKFREQSATSYEYIAVPVRTTEQRGKLETLVKSLPPMPIPGTLLIDGTKNRKVKE